MLYPFIFKPIFQERVWGGRRLESLYGKSLPAGKLIGESWEISDRPGAESQIANGTLRGKTMRWLMKNHASELLGGVPARHGRFPWLAKILDAHADLSVQVHPPTCIAKVIGAESKTEAWYIAHAEPEARLIAGLHRETTPESFKAKIGQSDFADCLHSLPAQAHKAIFIPSGRIHSLGAGTVVFEIQEDSDTTYRVHDWNRTGLDGKPRELHVEQALQSIDFNDTEPTLCDSPRQTESGYNHYLIAQQPGIFHLSQLQIETGETLALPGNGMRLLAITDHFMTLQTKEHSLHFKPGDFALIPASIENPVIQGQNARFLLTQPA